jgi:hypothetical protein
LECYGARSDLEILDTVPIFYPDKVKLARNTLYHDYQFMMVLFELLASSHKSLALEAWKLASRLPLYEKFGYNLDPSQKEEDSNWFYREFEYNLNLSKEYLTCYWLHVTTSKKQFTYITKEVLSAVLKMSIETACVGLKVAYECE